MDENNINNFKMDVVNFARTLTPLPLEVKQGTTDNKPVKWGDDNLYPNFLLQLYNEVPLHNGITKTKVNHILGDGVIVKATGKKADFKLNDVDTLEEIVRKITLDYLIFNFFIIEVQYNAFGDPISYNHLPVYQLRANEPLTQFWFCKDWAKGKNLIDYQRWTRGKSADTRSKIFMYSAYNPSANTTYPMATYNASILQMYTEILIKEFNKNNIEDGFSPNTIIDFFKGIPTAEQARKLEDKFNENTKGANGKRTLLNWNEVPTGGGTGAGIQVHQLGAVDYAAALVEVRNTNIEAILTVHQATSRSLYGIESPGSLGDRNAIEQAFQTFKNVFVKDARNVIESGLNKLLMDNGFPEIEFKDQGTFFTPELSDATKEKVMTIDELRAVDSLPILANGEGNKLVTATAVPTFSLSTPTGSPAQFSNVDSTDYSKGRMLKEQDFELVKDLGISKDNFTIITKSDFHIHSKQDLILFDDDKDIENYLIQNEDKNEGKTLSVIKADIKKELGISSTTDDLESRIKALSDAKVLKSTIVDGKIKVAPKTDDATVKKNEVQVLYEYKVRAGFGKPIIDTSRGFCIKLIENDRLYSRSEIQDMSSIFGYSVFEHCGGWFFNSATQKSENQCRHFWNMVRVIKKEN